MDYDLIRLFEHDFSFRHYIPHAIATFGSNLDAGAYEIEVKWKLSQSDEPSTSRLKLTWDIENLRTRYRDLDEELDTLRNRHEDKSIRVEMSAIVVAVAVMTLIEPGTRFTRLSAKGTGHDFYLNETRDEMIEIAGRSTGSLSSVFDTKREQSDKNSRLRKRWVSVTVFDSPPVNRTEGLHS